MTAAAPEPVTAVQRKTAHWENRGADYVLSKHNYKSQYAQMYYARLMELAPLVKQRAEQQWAGVPVVKVLALEGGIEQVVVGTVYKDMQLKPTALKEYTEDVTMAQQLAADTFCDDEDALVLEDETARIKLSGEIDVGCLVTGIIIGVRGVLDEKAGVFVVEETCFAGLPPQPAREPLQEQKFLAVVSGLCVGDPAVDLPRNMLLIDWIKGLFGDAERSKDVVRLVVCGVPPPTETLPVHCFTGQLVELLRHLYLECTPTRAMHRVSETARGNAGGTQSNLDQLATAPAASKQQVFAMEAVQEVDRCATELASALPVDLMPGPGDLSNHALPQQPLHHCLFPGAAPCSSFTTVTNPHRFSVDGVHFLGTSGQNVHDIKRYSRDRTSVKILADNMLQRHLCPTAPDTLACFPYVDKDPFILRETPHIYFAGNQAEFAEEEVIDGDRKVKVVSVPAFAKTGAIVLINLSTLECSPVTFDASLS